VAASASAVFAEPPGLAVQTVSKGRLNGVYVTPSGAKGLAVRFAGQGFAAFALNYFACDMSGIETIPNVDINGPVELIGDARDWITSSWSWQGEPLAYIRLRPYVEGNPEYLNNTERYERSRENDLEADRLELIPVEQSPANFLLIGGGKDEVWASGKMATRLAARLKSAGWESDVTALVFPETGYGICGDGTYPPHLWCDPSSDPRVKDLVAEGEAAVKAWQAIGPFFKSTLTPGSQAIGP
jgi:BAAT / Acyl-CoA thioester hydrolase C terminal